MADKDQDFSDTEALKEEIGGGLSKRAEDVFPSNFRRFLVPTIPDPNQLSIPSEPVVRGTFADRLPHTEQTVEGFMVGERMKNKGSEIVLNSILKQLESFPSLRGPEDEFTLPGLDIFFAEIFKKPGSLTNEADQSVKELLQQLEEFKGGPET